ncbi:hypothetical protein JW823_05460 [bacterium]|nr:hypothetical protein [candidate division CSSED10-310 bacterium]
MMDNLGRSLVLVFTGLITFSGLAGAGFYDEMTLTGTFESTYWDHDPDDWEQGMDIYEGPYSSFENQLMIHAGWRNWFGELRLRNMKYDDGIHYDYRSREPEADFEVFKFKLGYRGELFEVTGGDFYQSLGRGIVLYVQEDKDLNLDRTIRGGNVRFSSDRFDFQAFGGEIEWYKFLDNAADLTYKQREIKDELIGGMASVRVSDGIRLGLNYVTGTLYEFIRNESVGEDFQTGSVNVEATSLADGLIDVYAEYAKLYWDSDAPYGTETEDGEAIYGSLTSYLGDFTVQLEYKDYDYWTYRYGRPPTADREDEVNELDDTKGGRIKLDYFIGATDTLVYVSYSQFNNQGHPDYLGRVQRNENTHYYLGIEQNWSHLYAHVTYGFKEYEEIDETHRRATADLVFTFMDRHSLNLYGEYKYTEISGFKKDEYKTYLTYSLSPYVAVTGHYNRHEFDSDSGTPSSMDDWWAGEVTVTPIDTLTINVLYGGLPTGLLCSGGQCRIVPEFEGVQASLTYRF